MIYQSSAADHLLNYTAMNESSTQPIIELNNVDKFFGDFQALKNINLSVDVGEKVVVCGPSGSGKSTMIRCINHIESHDAGTITVDGIELTEDMNNVLTIRREVGMVFQQFNLFPHLTVLENLTLAPMKARRLSSKEAKRYCDAIFGTSSNSRTGQQISQPVIGWPTAAGRDRTKFMYAAENHAV